MLTVLCVTKARRRLWGGKKVISAVLKTGSGSFRRISAPAGRDGQPDWTAVRREAGREAGRLLLPRGMTPPAGSGIGRFAGCELARRMAADAGLTLLRMASLNPRLVSVGVLDKNAVMPDLPLAFLPYAADVRVITARPERYILQKHAAMRDYGAALSVLSDAGQLRGCLLVLAPDGLPERAEVSFGKNGLCLSAVPAGGKHGVADGFLPHVRDSLRAVLPPGCELAPFLAGLYELSGVREIAGRPPEFLRLEGRTVSLKEAMCRMAGLPADALAGY